MAPLSKHQLRPLAYLSLIVFVVAACAPSGPGTTGATGAPGAKPGGGTVTVRMFGSWGPTLDPPKVQGGAGWGITMTAYDLLINIRAGKHPIPYLAKSWKLAADSVTFT